jgi:hypothetical protein
MVDTFRPGAQSQPVVDPAGLVARLVGSPAGQVLAKGGAAHGFEAVVARPAVKGGVEGAGLDLGVRAKQTALGGEVIDQEPEAVWVLESGDCRP